MRKQRKSSSQSAAPNFYSVGLVEQNGVFKVMDGFEYRKVNQYWADWRRTDSRELARAVNRGKLVIK